MSAGRLRKLIREHRTLLLIGVGTVYTGWVASMLATVTARLATNWFVVVLAALPGVIVAGFVGLLAGTSTPPDRQAKAQPTAPGYEPLRTTSALRSFLVDAERTVDRVPQWLRELMAAGAVLSMMGVTAGLLFGSFFDGIRVSLLEGGHGSPGRFLLILSVALLAGFLICETIKTEDWRYFLILGAAATLLGSFAVGVRRWTGIYPEAQSIGSAVADGAPVTRSSLVAIAHALDSRAAPPLPSGSRWTHAVAVSATELSVDANLWEAVPIVLRGNLSDLQDVREARNGVAIRVGNLRSASGADSRVLMWFGAGDDARCDSVTVIGQLLTRGSERHGYRPTILASEWHCDHSALYSQESLVAMNKTGYWTTVRRFETRRPVEELQEVVAAYRGITGAFPAVIAVDNVNWTSGVSGSSIFVGPYADAVTAATACDHLRVRVGESQTCFVINAAAGPTTFSDIVAAA